MPKISIPCPGNTQLLPTSLVTFGNILYFLLSFLFTFFSPSYLLDQVLGWQVLGFGGLCVVIDCLAGETRQLAVELLQQFVTTLNLLIPSMSHNLQEPKSWRCLLLC